MVDLPQFLTGLFIFIFGLALGSFTTCVVYRIPRGLSIWKSEESGHRSLCPSCKHALAWNNLIPVFSWVFQKGKCAYCGKAIGWHYPVIEAVVLCLTAGLFIIFGVSVKAFLFSLMLPVLAGLAAFGLKKRLF